MSLDVPFREQLWQWLYATNVQLVVRGDFDRVPYGVAHFWSLAVEEQFYLLWPWVVRHLSNRGLAKLCIAMLVAAPLARLLAVLVALPSPAGYVLLPGRMDAFAAGALVALAVRHPRWAAVMRRYTPAAIVAGGGALAAIFLWRREFAWEDPVVKVLGYSVLTVFFGALVAGAATGSGRFQRASGHAALRFFGRYSYAMYVFHLPLLPFYVAYGFSPNGWWSGQLQGRLGTRVVGIGLFMLCATVLTALVAVVSWHVWEKHFLRLKDRFPYQPPRRSRGAALDRDAAA